ncbi:hypothetical protein MATL_G00123750 [Megalops atlanticus]|uniref:Apolipoprotein A-V n=1 Tax=Megalops atlanticus TaxID=7932 RepID=A0A9D3PZ84_MEGAT|nr:hypothetical protein MATL_G00123750 [Megalops atlanticus]
MLSIPATWKLQRHRAGTVTSHFPGRPWGRGRRSAGTQTEKDIMHLKLVVFAFSLLAAAAYPVLPNDETSWREGSRDNPGQIANQAADKTPVLKDVHGGWKQQLEDSELYSRDVPAGWPKLGVASEQLRARLMQELRELREKLAAYAPPPETALRDRLAPLTRHLRGALHTSTQELCARLARAPEAAGEGQQAAAWRVGLAVGGGLQDLSAHLEQFHAQVSAALRELGGTLTQPSQEEVTAALRTEVEAFRAGLQSRAAALQAGLEETPSTAQSLRERLSKGMAQFCHASSEQNQQLSDRIERYLEGLGLGEGQGRGPGEVTSPPLGSTGSLKEDFSLRLSALLRDIMQTLN